MENMPERIDSKFRFVLLSASRAEQMIQGARSKVDGAAGKVTRIAMDEILTDAVEWEYGPAPESEGSDATIDGDRSEAAESKSK